MKQKQVKASPKPAKQTRLTKKGVPPKKTQEVVEESDDEEEVVQKKVVEKKSVKKNIPKAKKVVEEPSEDEVEEEEDEVDEEEDELEEDEQEVEDVDEEGSDEENEAEAEDDEEDEDEDDDDDEPSEEAIEKEEPTIPSQVKTGPIPPTVSLSKVIFITKLPKVCKQIDIVEVFGKYGAIDQVHIVTTPTGTFADVAYKTEKGAFLALAAHKKEKIKDSMVWVRMKKEKVANKNTEDRDRRINVKYIKTGTTEEEVKKHFEDCGTIEKLFLKNKFKNMFAVITFADKSAIPAALKLHNSVLNGVNIRVTDMDDFHRDDQFEDENVSVLVRNKQNFESIDVAKVEAIFSKCGEIEKMDIVCTRNVLAFIKFKTEEAAQKAIILNGKTEQGIELEVEIYDPVKKWTSIHISNLSKDCTVEDLTKVFSRAGEIENVTLKPGFAIIRFKDSDGYCKSFLYNECYIKGNIVFLQPNSFRKKSAFKFKQGFKRAAENGKSVFKPKRARK